MSQYYDEETGTYDKTPGYGFGYQFRLDIKLFEPYRGRSAAGFQFKIDGTDDILTFNLNETFKLMDRVLSGNINHCDNTGIITAEFVQLKKGKYARWYLVERET